MQLITLSNLPQIYHCKDTRALFNTNTHNFLTEYLEINISTRKKSVVVYQQFTKPYYLAHKC